MAGSAGAANVPSGITGLWRFQSSTNLGQATMGSDLMFSNAVYGAHSLGPWTDIGIESWHTKFSDGGVFQEQSWNYLAVNPNFVPNGGGSYVNDYTIAIDYVQTQNGKNSLFQTARNGNGTDGDLFIEGTTRATATIGVDAVGFSTQTFDASTWHRIVWSVSNGNFFRVYVDGTLFLDGAGQPVDGRFALYPDRFNLFADDSWQDMWGLVGTVMTWNRALTTEEIAGMGGWIGANTTPTPLLFSDQLPELLSVSPANGETNVAPGFAYQASILDLVGLVNVNSIQLLLDGAPVLPVTTVMPAMKTVSFSAGGLLPSGSTHTYSLILSASGVSTTNHVTFTVQKYTSYEWRFTSGDLSPALGNGVMAYADEWTTPGLTSFGTTDGSTVSHINGSPAQYMHVPGFTLDTDGYWLTFPESGPNVNGGTNINRYTLLMDVMIPSPWAQDYLVPFFNTAPYNNNDADFYLRGDGAIGLGGGGYSAAGVMSSNAWCRLAFVADLKANTLTYYVNGTNVKSRAADGLDGRWGIFSNQEVPPYPASLLLFNEGDTSGIYTHELYVSSVAFTDRVLGAGELAALGGPSASGILTPSFGSKPTLHIQPSGSDATVSWPSSFIGYALEQADTVASPQWKPVAGVTNNSVTLSPGCAVQFFRLIQ